MHNITVENFKAFHRRLGLDSPSDENVLIYGENGSGKTSLFEAFHFYYFKDKIFNERIPANVVVGRADEEDAVIKSFCYDRTNEPMTLSVDNVAYSGYTPATDEQIFLLSYLDIHPQGDQEDHICIREILDKACFKYDANLTNWFDDSAEREIVGNTNKILEDVFYIKGLKLMVSQTGDGICILEKEHTHRQRCRRYDAVVAYAV